MPELAKGYFASVVPGLMFKVTLKENNTNNTIQNIGLSTYK